ncbi:hypothetical protein GGF49_005282, partial [Coemansia sp. RSA 1853]
PIPGRCCRTWPNFYLPWCATTCSLSSCGWPSCWPSQLFHRRMPTTLPSASLCSICWPLARLFVQRPLSTSFQFAVATSRALHMLH